MKMRKIIMPLVAISLLLLMVAWMAGAFKEKIEPGVSVEAALQNTDTVAVIKRNTPRFEPVPASIEAKQATVISSRMLARIEKVSVRAGDTVKKGQLLIQLEQKDLLSKVSQSKQQIKAVNARLTEAKLSLSRALELVKKGVLAQADLDKARANHDSLIADHATAKQALLEAKTALEFAQIRSPIDGRVIDRFAEPGDTAQPGIQLLSIYNPLSLRIAAAVREQLVINLKLGQALQVSIPSLNKTYDSSIEELVPAGDSGSRSFLVKSRLQYGQGLLPGMYARLMVPAGEEQLLLIPFNRIAQVGQLNVVWVLSEGKVERRFIRVGKNVEGGLVEVISGLYEAELLLSVPLHNKD